MTRRMEREASGMSFAARARRTRPRPQRETPMVAKETRTTMARMEARKTKSLHGLRMALARRDTTLSLRCMLKPS